MKKRIFVIACTCVLIVCAALGIGYNAYSKDNLTEITFKDEDLKNQNYILGDMYITNDENKSLGLYFQDNEESTSKLYSFNKSKGEYTDPKEIELPDGMQCEGISVTPDESKIYMTILRKQDNPDNSKSEIAYSEFNDLDDLKIDNLKFIDELNSTSNKINSVDNKGDLIYCAYSENDIRVKYAELKDNKYNITNLNNEYEGHCYGAALSPDGQTVLISIPFDGDIHSVHNILVMKKTGDSWSKPELLNSINDGKNDKVQPKISGNGKNLYFLDQTSFILNRFTNKEIENKIFKTDLKNIIKEFENYKNNKDNNEEDKKVEEKSRTFDTAQFDAKPRDKGDMSKKKGIYYEIFVRAFADSNGDGFGDINGVTQKLDYLKELGVDGIWLMPINASPTYHGYDIIDYYTINKDYGTMDDFKNLINEAHKRDIKVIMDLVVNHTSNANPWFTQSSIDKNSKYRDYYRWVSPDDSENMNVDDKSAWGSQVWTKDRDSYYYSIFWSGMPDLNYNNKDVREEVKNIAKTYLEYGVDGFRLDGAIHVYGDHEFEKQAKDNLNNNITWWNEFATACEEVNPNVYIVGEAWHDDDLMPEYAKVFDSKFDFTFRYSLFEAINKGSAVVSGNMNLSDKFADINKELEASDKNYIDAIFSGNHDIDRTMSLLKSEEKSKLVANIYLTLPGNPFIYYGEEIGMKGEGDDEYKRLPFKWNDNNAAPNTNWFELYSGQKTMLGVSTASLEKQKDDENSIYNNYKKIIAVRKNNKAFEDGKYESINSNNDSIMAYKMSDDTQDVYIIHNLSDSAQTIELPEAANSQVVFASNSNTNMTEGKVTLDKTSSIVITVAK